MKAGDAKQPHLLEKMIFRIEDKRNFEDLTFQVFNFQFENNPVYAEYCQLLEKNPGNINSLSDIPFLPVEFFKSHKVTTFSESYEKLFLSSGTTNMERSKHYVKKMALYKKSFLDTFIQFYGEPSNYCLLALLPGYYENENSSLIFMVRELIDKSNHPESGFYLNDMENIFQKMMELDKKGQPIILFGVSFALIDMAERYSYSFNHLIVIETGGMKGRRKEITREELHSKLKKSFGLPNIHSEYGMAELLSQAYSKGEGKFYTPPWVKILIREYYDPFSVGKINKSGGINIIDLANLYSCSFIETKDIGRKNEDGSVEVLGRFDSSEIRGCNLMVLE